MDSDKAALRRAELANAVFEGKSTNIQWDGNHLPWLHVELSRLGFVRDEKREGFHTSELSSLVLKHPDGMEVSSYSGNFLGVFTQVEIRAKEGV